MSDETYVSSSAWLRQIGRPDHVDEIADQFERPVAQGMESFWQQGDKWPRTPRGWRSLEHVSLRSLERRAG
jgi:hypothetical protein